MNDAANNLAHLLSLRRNGEFSTHPEARDESLPAIEHIPLRRDFDGVFRIGYRIENRLARKPGWPSLEATGL